MYIKRIFSQLFVKKERRDKDDLLKEIMLFVNQIKNEYSLDKGVDVQLNDKLPINNGNMEIVDNICIVQIGVNGCRGSYEHSEEKWITLKNTIVHELKHAKNNKELTPDTQEKKNVNLRSLTHLAIQLVDEYNAYKTADDRFKQVNLDSTEKNLQRALQLIWINKDFIKMTQLDANSRYIHFYDLCTAIIVHSLRNVKFPSIDETYSGYNDMCKKIIGILEEYNSKMPLDYAKYEEAGEKLWIALLIMVPKDLISNFRENTGIRWVSVQKNL